MSSIGFDGKIYRNTATYATPTWVEVTAFENVNVNFGFGQAESNSRDSQFERYKLGTAKAPVTARLKTKAGNADYEAIMDAFALGTVLDLLILDGSKDTVGSRGIRAEYHVFDNPQDQSMGTRLYNALQLLPADTDNPPKWAKVGTGPALQYAVPGGAWA